MLQAPVVALLLFGGPSIEDAGDRGCPTAAAVEGQLATLTERRGGRATDAGGSRRVRMSDQAGMLRVELLGEAPAPLAERTFARQGSCDELAAAVAVVVATWLTALDGGEPERFSVAPAPPAPSPAPRAPPPVTALSAPAPTTQRAALSLNLGLGLLAAIGGGDVAPGARVEARLARREQGLGLALAISGVMPRTAGVGPFPEAARWSRGIAAAGPEYRFGTSRPIDLHLLALASVLRTSGVELPRTRSETSGQVGAGAGVRAGWQWGTAFAWAALDGLLFPGRDELVVSGLPSRTPLPRFEIQVASGISLGRAP